MPTNELASELLPQDMAVCDQRVGLDYYRLSADNRLLFGGLCNYSGRHPKDITASIRPKMIKVFPQLEHTRVDYEWGGYIAITIKRIPQMGRIQGNTYYAFGYSGHGLAPTHIAGQILADGRQVVCESRPGAWHALFPIKRDARNEFGESTWLTIRQDS
jgi:glycine/D-amino acid oxidase-like deaminating enzyme